MQASGGCNVSLVEFPTQQDQAALNPKMSCSCELLAALLHVHIWLGCMQVATCHHLQHLNLSQCVGLTDAGIAALGTAPAVTSGRCAAKANIRFLLALICTKMVVKCSVGVSKWLVGMTQSPPHLPPRSPSLPSTCLLSPWGALSCLDAQSTVQLLWGSGLSQQTPNAMPNALIVCSTDTLTVGEHLLCRLWYLNISELGTHFTGATLYHFLMAWGTAKLQGMGTAPTSLR